MLTSFGAWFLHEDSTRSLWTNTTVDSHKTLRISFLVQIGAGSFINPDFNTLPLSLNDGGNPFGLTTLWHLRQPIILMTSISDEELIATGNDSFPNRSGRFTASVGQLNWLLPWEWISVPSDPLVTSLAWNSIASESIEVVIISLVTAFSFPYPPPIAVIYLAHGYTRLLLWHPDTRICWYPTEELKPRISAAS